MNHFTEHPPTCKHEVWECPLKTRKCAKAGYRVEVIATYKSTAADELRLAMIYPRWAAPHPTVLASKSCSPDQIKARMSYPPSSTTGKEPWDGYCISGYTLCRARDRLVSHDEKRKAFQTSYRNHNRDLKSKQE